MQDDYLFYYFRNMRSLTKEIIIFLSFLFVLSCSEDERFDADVFFTINVEVDGTMAHAQIVPAASDVCYFYDFFTEESQKLYSDDFSSAVQLYLNSLYGVYLSMGYDYPSASTFITSYGVSSYDYECTKYTDYTLFACAVDPFTGKIVSTISTHKFSSEGVRRSDNKISFTVENISTHGADFTVHTSNQDPYYVGVYKTDEIEGKDEGNILPFIMEHDGPGALISWIRHGERTFSKDTFSPSTSYSVIAFGYVSGELTTDIFKMEFTTLSPSCGISVQTSPYYSGDELYQIDSVRYEKCQGRAVVPLKADVWGEYEHYYYNVYKYSKGFDDPEKLPDSSVVETLLNRSKNTQVDTPLSLMTIVWEDEVIVFAVAISKDGQLSEVFRQRFQPHKNEVSPTEEFLEKYGNYLKSNKSFLPIWELFQGG